MATYQFLILFYVLLIISNVHLGFCDCPNDGIATNETQFRDCIVDGKTFELGNDIDFNIGSTGDMIQNSPTFEFDGNGYTIYLQINTIPIDGGGSSEFGIITTLAQNTVAKNFRIYSDNDFEITNCGTSCNLGTFAGITSDNTITSNVTVLSSLGGDRNFVGGIIGSVINSEITDSKFEGSINAEATGLGGISGSVRGSSIESCASNAGIQCSSQTFNIGILAGQMIDFSTLLNSKCNGTVSAPAVSRVGGMVGEMSSSSAEHCKAEDIFVEANNDVGGFVGNVNAGGTITNSTSSGYIIAEENNGGFAGLMSTNTIATECHSQVDVESNFRYAGGFVGRQRHGSEIRLCSSNSNVHGRLNVGCFAGSSESGLSIPSMILESYSIGFLNSTTIGESQTHWVGGFIAVTNHALINNTYTRCNVRVITEGDVINDQDVGGFVGNILGSAGDDTIQRSYTVSTLDITTTGSVSGSRNIGCFAGDTNVVKEFTSEFNYYDNEQCSEGSVGTGSDAGITGLTTDEMQGESASANMQGYDFENVWIEITYHV